MNRQEFLRLVCREIHFIFDRKSIQSELIDHLNDSKQALIEEGLSEEEAEFQAIAQMGEPVEIGKALNQEHHPLLGYLWMISKVLLIVVVLLTTVVGFEGLQSLLDVSFPSASVGYLVEEKYPVNMKFETQTHKVIIDYICLNNWGEYYFVYRAKTKPDYIRASQRMLVFEVGYNSSETTAVGGTCILAQGRFGYKGYNIFKWPGDNTLYFHCNDGNVVKWELEGYFDETR